VIVAVYGTYLLAGFFLTLILTHGIRDFANTRGWLCDPVLERHVHTKAVPRLGGVAIAGAFFVIVMLGTVLRSPWGFHFALSRRSLACVIGSIAIVFFLGLYDDFHGVGPYLKFAVQIVASVLLYTGGIGVQRIDLYSVGHRLTVFVALPVTVVWVLLITNAFNLIDGLDGLAAGSAFFSTIVLFVMSLFVQHYAVTILTTILAGAILGFLRYNFYPASIFLGDSGSMFIGFVLAALALAGSEKAPITIAAAIPVLCFGLPILDVALAISRRFLRGKAFFAADADHIHHKLLKRGLSQRGAVLILYAVTAIFALLSLVVLHDAALIALVVVLIALGIALGLQYLGYAEFSEVRSFFHRTALQKRAVANNVEVRHAIEALKSCPDADSLYKILKGTLQSIGFDGFRLGSSSMDAIIGTTSFSLERTKDGEVQSLRDDLRNSESMWELRFDLTTVNHRRLGYCSLLRVGTDSPLLVDLNLLISEFRAALSLAIMRITSDGRFRLPATATKKLIKVKAASASNAT
jgi:UDP-GlcNAc:undecaprenyl-phosphate/decaprenyl-phosphate GlcNAc-1-phosphate transferase